MFLSSKKTLICCNICKVSLFSETLQESLQKLFSCPLCSKDIKTRGSVNGIGYAVYQCLIKKHGHDIVLIEKSKLNLLKN
jgi:transcription initiation factor IIE alpha subunit